MAYITVRGNLGSTCTIINGMDYRELDQLTEHLHRGPKHEDTDAVTFFDPAMRVINLLESLFGYEVVSCNNVPTPQGRSTLHHVDMTMWMMYKNDSFREHDRRDSYQQRSGFNFGDGLLLNSPCTNYWNCSLCTNNHFGIKHL
ncbi:hypothetical protein O3M35_011558 [Rhynocoris fuscipes]|uniref:Uncharacterized protein n=1 Tax=Rhynocoris fuscipes TaxID=488301 RepID=A0AAW1CVK3_9HEMI